MNARESVEILSAAVDIIEDEGDLSAEDLAQVALALAMLKSFFRLGSGRTSTAARDDDERDDGASSRRARFGSKILGR